MLRLGCLAHLQEPLELEPDEVGRVEGIGGREAGLRAGQVEDMWKGVDREWGMGLAVPLWAGQGAIRGGAPGKGRVETAPCPQGPQD